MTASLDEASTGYRLDAPIGPATSFYLLLGDNARGYSNAANDFDAYALHVDIGSNYAVAAFDLTTNAGFRICDRFGNSFAGSIDFGDYSAYAFTARDSLYYIVTYSDGAGFYRLRAENISFMELNGIGEFITAGQTYTAAIDYASDSDHYLFNAVAGHTYGLVVTTSLPDLFIALADVDTGERISVDATSGGVYTFTAPYTGTFDLALSSNSFYTTGVYSFIAGEIERSLVITSNGGGDSAAVAILENSRTVTTVTASARPGAPGLSYTIIGGADAARFQINSATGALSFVAAPSFEAPSDVGGDNIYDVIVQVSDGSLSDAQAIAVTVKNQSPETVTGTGADDTLRATAEREVFMGLLGSDTVTYELATAAVIASLSAPAGNTGFAAGDTYNSIENLRGSAFGDSLTGDAGANALFGGGGVDTMAGGLGNDTYGIDLLTDVVIEAENAGIDLVRVNVGTAGGTYSLAANIENSTLTNGVAFNLFGNALNNVLTGNAQDNVLLGAGGVDTMAGGLGNDTYGIDLLTDVVTEAANAGIDLVRVNAGTAGGTYSLAANVENSTLTNGVAFNLFGNALNNVLTGNALANVMRGLEGNDSLNGAGGNDTLFGGLGNDTLTGGAGADVFVFNFAPNLSSNFDRITDFSVADDTIQLENAVFTDLGLATGTLSAAAFVTGTAALDAADRIVYNSATGALFYDSNGSAAGGAIQIAALSAGLALTYNDFMII